MEPKTEPYRDLALSLLRTRPDEISCEDWLHMVGAYAEAALDGRPTPAGLEEVRRHMEMCPECVEEFQALLRALCDQG